MARVTRMTKRRLGELLRAEGLVSEEQVQLALNEQRKSNLFLGEALVRLGFVTEDAIASTISQQFRLPFINVEQYTISKDLLEIFPLSLLREYQFIPIDKIGNILLIVGAGLMNHDVLDELERLSKCRVCQYVGTWKNINEAMESHFKDKMKEPTTDLSSMGNMLLSQEEEAVSAEVPSQETEEVADDIAAAVNAVTSTSSSVVEEALAALEATAASKKKPVAAAAKPAAPGKAVAPAAKAPVGAPVASVTPSGTSERMAGSGRVSAFTANRPQSVIAQKPNLPAPPVVKKEEKPVPAVPAAAKKADAESTSAIPKGGLLGFLKK